MDDCKQRIWYRFDTGLLHLYNCSLSCFLHCSSDTCMVKLQHCNCKAHGFYSFPHFSPHVWNNSPKTVGTLLLSLPSKQPYDISLFQIFHLTNTLLLDLDRGVLMFKYFMPLILLSMCLLQAALLPISASKMKRDGKKRERETIQQRLLHRCCRWTAPSWLPVWTASLSTLSSTWTQISSRLVMLTALCVLCVTTVCVPVHCVICAISVYGTCVGIHSGQPLSLHSASPGYRYIYIFMVGDADRTLYVCCVLLLCMCACTLCCVCTLCVCVYSCVVCALCVYVCGHPYWTASLSTLSFTWTQVSLQLVLAYIFMVGDAASCVCALFATTVHVCMYSVCTCVHYVCMYVCAICIHALWYISNLPHPDCPQTHCAHTYTHVCTHRHTHTHIHTHTL